MIFNKKITLYLNDGAIRLEDVADFAADAVDDNWLLSEEDGRWEQKCQCGDPDCVDAAVEVL